MRRSCGSWLWLASLFVLVLARTRHAEAQKKPAKRSGIPVQVVDLAADRAYIEPGSSAGLSVGDEVRLGAERYRVASVSSSFAALAIEGKLVPIGTRGMALVTIPGQSVELRPEPPEPLARFRREWRPAPLPASTQTPAAVPLGGASSRSAASRLTVSESLYGVVPADGDRAFVGNELKGRLHYEPFTAAPLAFDVDLALRTYAGDEFDLRPGAAARQIVRVQELSLSYGTGATFRGVLGRLRAASSLVGQLDGLRLEAPLTSELRLSAYGGGTPHTFNGGLSTQVARFGTELSYQDAATSLRPRLVAGAYASHFDGTLDEKKAYASFDLMPSSSRLGGFAQVSLFEPNNPWNASTIELSAAVLDADVTLGAFHVGGSAGMHRPDRSRWLSTLLPPEWLCWSSPASARAPCSASDATYSWLINGGVTAGKLSVDLGGQSAFTVGTDATSYGSFANLRWLDLIGRVHLDAGMSVHTGSVMRSAAVAVSPGIMFADGRADVSLRYRPALVRYRATLRSSAEHSVGASMWLALTDSLDVDVEGDWIKASELSVFMVQGVAVWRLGF